MSTEINPVISTIVPARNEEASLATCLESLISQSGITFEIIIVDDASTDHTAEIARSFLTTDLTANPGAAGVLARPTLTLISAPALPNNWTGKNNAMSAGAKIAKGRWLLFTDADTVHQPGSLARAVAEAEQRGAALLSYSPEQEVRSFWEKAVMPVIFAELAATYPPHQVNDPASPIAAANGQYLMISREAYDAVSGHTKIASDLLEDVAMARLLKSSGMKIFFRYGGDAVRTRMYRSWSQMKEGWTKNLALLFRNPGVMAARYAIESFLLIAAASGAAQTVWFVRRQIRSQGLLLRQPPMPDQYFPLFRGWMTISVVLLLVYVLLRSIRRVIKAHFPLRLSLISICGVPLFAYLLLRSTAARRNGTVSWKGRRYGSASTSSLARDSPHASSAGVR